ncbi:hypothetical protein DVR12_17550 [Chitinophaga silvatica]|uniref:Lipoprotein n=1 Tax=Chitinophaga silvatica TaxID=2282649 RepID=A0A3E1Y7S8_9BACT|nr:hypothetical protein [Chitinophaga silvatica]RFS21140.1 hypothetical protein DVR12_17550 [Chitinophaga silvatica]
MSKRFLLFSLSCFALGCIKNDKDYVEPTQAMFWISQNLGCGPIAVTINGVTHTITNTYPELPDCGATNTATFDLTPGVYSYKASCSSQSWEGNITVIKEACTSLELKKK